MEEKNFLSFMEFLRFLESEDLKGTPVGEAMKRLASYGELAPEQRKAILKEFPGILSKFPWLPPKQDTSYY